MNQAEPTVVDYPECSGNAQSCPENEGYGCCGRVDPLLLHLVAMGLAHMSQAAVVPEDALDEWRAWCGKVLEVPLPMDSENSEQLVQAVSAMLGKLPIPETI